jgi:membrane protease YdiL (CAAX protease family)
MDLPAEPLQPPPVAEPGPPAPAAALPPDLPLLAYFVVVAGLYTLAGGLAEFFFLPLGIWWNQILLFIVPTVLLLRAKGFRAGRFLRFHRLPAKRQGPLVLAISVAVFFSASALMAACEDVAPRSWVDKFDLSKILDSIHGPWQVVLFASVVIGAPLAEEVVFRGYLLPALRQRMELHEAVFVQALLFSAVHMDPIGFLPRLLLGLVFGYLVAMTGSLWSSVFAHALNNGVSTVLFFVYGPGPDSEVAPESPLQALLLSLGMGLAVFGLLSWLRTVTPEEPLPPTQDPDARSNTRPAFADFYVVLWGSAVVTSLAAFAVAWRFLPNLPKL